MKLLWIVPFAAIAACHSPAPAPAAFPADSVFGEARAPAIRAPLAQAPAPSTPPNDAGPRARVSAGIEVGAGAGSFGSLFAVEGEIPVGERIAIVPRILSYSYSWEGEGDFTDDAEEDGDGTGFGAEVRFYPKKVLEGFYVGAGAGVFPLSDWEYRDGGTVETGDSASFTAYGATGYMFEVGDRFSFGPTAILGSYVSDSPESGVYGGVGIRFGINF